MCLVLLQASWLSFVNIGDRVREQEKAYNNSDEHMIPSGVWPVNKFFKMYTQYKIVNTTVLVLNDQLSSS